LEILSSGCKTFACPISENVSAQLVSLELEGLVSENYSQGFFTSWGCSNYTTMHN